MRKRRNKRVELALTIVAGVFFIAAAVLFFLIPTLDNAFEAHPAGLSPYKPWDLFVGGIKALVSFDFSSTKYILIFVVGVVLIVLLIVWLVFIIIKKKPIKLIYWSIVLVLIALSAFMVSGYVLATCREVYVYSSKFPLNGRLQTQTVFDDLRNLYEIYVIDARHYADAVKANGYKVESVVIVASVLYHSDMRVLAWIVLASIGVIAVLGLAIPVFGIIAVVKKPVEVSFEETEEERAAREAREAEEQLRREREAQYIAYVEYAAGKESREKEYRELCEANGIALPKEDDGEEYYKELSKELPVFTGEAVVDEDEEYYKRLAKELGVLNGSVVPSDEDEEYYKALAKELPALQEQDLSGESSEQYVRRLSKELPVLQEQNLSEGESDEEYIARLSKELPALQAQVLETPEDPEIYVARLSKELPLFKAGQNLETEEERVSRLSKELPLLKEGQNIETKEARNARLLEELPLLKVGQNMETKEERNARIAEELPLLKVGQNLETKEERNARIARELPLLQEGQHLETEEERLNRIAKELPILHQKGAKVEDYHEKLAKELALFRLIDASREAEIGKYYRDIIKELDENDKLRAEEDDDLARGLKESVRAKRAYYKKMKEQLPCLNREKLAD